MLKIIAPTTIESVDEGNTVILEMSPDIFRTLSAGVQVAFEDADAVPETETENAAEIYAFFTGNQQ